ncbi:MAG: RNA polymerase sporulation sigma factor SigK [Clostridiales bacterium]|nr:RNA polymerase sporulation sigma factor SigK [Clostridiales bacterium]
MYNFIIEAVEIFKNLIFAALHIGGGNLFPKPLSKEQEEQAVLRMRQGDIKARNTLIEHNLRLVSHIIKKYYSSSNDRDDLISIGTVGLIKGINSFNPDKGVRLATYASRCIENEILMYFRSAKKTARDISMSDPIETDSEGNPLTLTDIIFTEDTISEDLDLKLKCQKLVEIIGDMPNGRDKQILVMRYGLDGREPMPQREVAQKLGISRSYVSRIETRLLKSLREQMENKKFSNN